MPSHSPGTGLSRDGPDTEFAGYPAVLKAGYWVSDYYLNLLYTGN